MDWILGQTWMLPFTVTVLLLGNVMWYTFKPSEMGGDDKVTAADSLQFFVIVSSLSWGGWFFYHLVMFISYYVWGWGV